MASRRTRLRVKVSPFGGALMVLAYAAREATRDVDAVILAPRETGTVRAIPESLRLSGTGPKIGSMMGRKGFLSD